MSQVNTNLCSLCLPEKSTNSTMKLHCGVTVINRLLSSLSMKSATKYKNAVICLSKTSKEQELHLVLVTKNNKAGYRYRILGNVERTFDQFSNEGKCTIRFKDPSHDLCITSEAMPLKRFLSYVKHAMAGSLPSTAKVYNEVHVPARMLSNNYCKLEVKKKEDYPVNTGFPSSLKILQANNCKLSKFDFRILKLKYLTTLALSKNKLKELPRELGNMSLKHLCLSFNNLANEKWLFLSGTISNSLECLDISGNELKALPPYLSRFHLLRILKASSNFIKSIPSRVCLLPHLQHLDICSNDVRTLPGSIMRRTLKRLDILDISGNQALSNIIEMRHLPSISFRRDNHTSLFSLLELAAQCIINSRIQYNEEILPSHLVRLLDDAGQCSCGKMTINKYGLIQQTADPKLITNTFISSERQWITLLTFSSCSPKYNTK